MPQLELRRPWAIGAAIALVGLVGVAALVGRTGSAAPVAVPPTSASATPAPSPPASSPSVGPVLVDLLPTLLPAPQPLHRHYTLPGGRKTVFGDHEFLVAYYGTAGTGSLGVLGETDPDTATRRLARAAAPFRRAGEHVQLVYELIVTVADAGAGRDHSYSHEIARPLVQRYITAAHRHGALLLLDLQPGRTDFLTVAKRWEWALRDPWVGLALDPEWRMGRRQIPARVVGSVSAAEVNRTATWLSELTRRYDLPEKLFMLHQFKLSMIRDVGAIRPEPGLAMVQHVDGFGNPGQKLDTFHAVVRPRQFTLGFKLFYDEDKPRMNAAAVRAIRPAVRFVSFQ